MLKLIGKKILSIYALKYCLSKAVYDNSHPKSCHFLSFRYIFKFIQSSKADYRTQEGKRLAQRLSHIGTSLDILLLCRDNPSPK